MGSREPVKEYWPQRVAAVPFRHMLRLSTVSVVLTLALAVLAACGSSTIDDTFSGSAARTNSAAQDAGAEDRDASEQDPNPTLTGAGPADAAPAPANARDAGDPCIALRAQVDRLRPEAMSCTITSLQPQCNLLVADVCCMVVVTKETPSTKNFVDAVKAFKAASCTVDCSKAHCSTAPSYVCQPMSGSKGTCQQ